MSSVMFPEAKADFATQLKNLTRQVGQLSRQISQPGTVIVTNPNAGTNVDTNVPTIPTAPQGNSTVLDPLGNPLPLAPPIVLQQGVYPVIDLTLTPGAYFSDVYVDVSWQVSPYSNAVAFDVQWGLVEDLPGHPITVLLTGSQRVSGNTLRVHGLVPNSKYGFQVVASNVLGQSKTTPPDGFLEVETTNDASIPPAVSQNGAVVVGQGATSVIVTFQPLTFEQAPDVANGNGVYLVEITTDSAFNTIARQVYTSAWVVAFNDIYPHTTLAQSLAVTDGPGTSVVFQDLSQVSPGAQFNVLIDDEYILFNAPTGNTATIAQRNSGITPLTTGPESHLFGAKVTFWSQNTWFARVAAIDASGNQGPWTTSTGAFAGGVVDSMLVGDFNAAHITFGLMQGDRIEVNSLSAGSLKTSTLSATTITLGAGGQMIAGNPPTTGLLVNSQGLTLYNGGVISVSFDAFSGQGTFSGSISASAIDSSTITGALIQTTNGSVVLSGETLSAYDASNKLRLQLGALSNGDYGISVVSPDGTLSSMVLPVNSDFSSSGGNTTSATPKTIESLGGIGPSVKAYIGPSQDAVITISATVSSIPTTDQGRVYLAIDGTVTSTTTAVVVGDFGASSTATGVIGLKAFLGSIGHANVSEGNHTFTIQFSSTSGGNCGIGQMSLIVEPV